MTKYCIDCGNSFNPHSSGASDIRDANCNRRLKSTTTLTDDIIKYKSFRTNLRQPKDFANEELAVEYYHTQLSRLLSMSNKSLETLLTEKAISQSPGDASELAFIITNYIEEVQGI
jgi:hypothetical protein